MINSKIISWPKISIVTPSFNQGEFIEQTIKSIISQNYPNLEYIIIDGGSTDNTISIINKYDKYISYWVSEKDNGQSDAINKGLKICTGDIFNWLNSDDFYEPKSLFLVASIFKKNQKIKYVSGYERHIYENGRFKIHNGTYVSKKFEKNIIDCEVSQPSTFFRLADVKSVEGLSVNLKYVMDGELWLKLLLMFGTKGFFKIHKILVNFRIHQNSKTFIQTTENGFLIDRSSIVYSLIEYVELENFIIDYFMSDYFKTPRLIITNTQWNLNSENITKKKIKYYFTKIYIQKQFINNNIENAGNGIKIMLRLNKFNYFVFKSILKIYIKKYV